MNKFSFLLVILLWLEVSECFNPPFIFNRIKPGHCPTDTKLLGKDKTKGAICDSIRCDHDYDCRDDLLCVSIYHRNKTLILLLLLLFI
jgi:hypothetical protein